MSEPQRVYLSMVIETDQAPEDVQLSVLASINDRFKVVNVSVGALGDDHSPSVSFVVCPVRGLLRTIVDDEDLAAELAKLEGAVVLSWTADADHRGEVTA